MGSTQAPASPNQKDFDIGGPYFVLDGGDGQPEVPPGSYAPRGPSAMRSR